MSDIGQLCPICQSEAAADFWTKYGKRPTVAGQGIEVLVRPKIYRCLSCGFRFTYPSPRPELLNAAYAAAGTQVWPDDSLNAICRDYPNRIQRICQYALTPSVLDIGCYTGEFLSHFPRDWAKAGIEPSGSAASVAQDRDIRIIGNDFFGTPIESGVYGVITAMNIIEHMPDPGAFIRKAADSLGGGGILVIETGDVHSRYARLMGEHWGYYHLPEHVSFFSREALVKLMQRSGLEIVENRSNLFFKKPWGVKGRLWHLRELAYAIASAIGWKTYKRFIVRERRPDTVRYALYRDHMLVIGRKNGFDHYKA